MAREKRHHDLYVYMNGTLIGILSRESTGQLVFTYDTSWISSKIARPISLSMPITETPYKGKVVDTFFDNLLPDNELILQRIQTRFGAPSKKSFDLLSFIGGDCVGALQILTKPSTSNIKSINAKPIDDRTIANLLKHYQTAPLGMDKAFDFRISIAGAQEKTALLYLNDKWNLPHSATPTTHIIKLPIGYIQHSGIDLSESCENEWICLQIAGAFGLSVAESEVLNFGDTKKLVVKRFDRKFSEDKKWIMRLPQEDMCQALKISPHLKYQQDGGPGIRDVMNLLLGANNPAQDREYFFRSQVLFWLLAAIDGHAKNFSIFIEPQGKFRLTPLYDIISAYPLIEKKQLQKQKIKMAMALRGESNHYHWHNIQRRHFISTANDARFSPILAEKILDDMLSRVEAVISQVSKSLPANFPKHISKPIFEGMRAFKQRLEK